MTYQRNRWLRRGGALAAALLALAAGGWLCNSLGRSAKEEECAAGLQQKLYLPADRGDALGQQLAVFSLGGLRSLVAELLSIDATNAWMKQDWERADKRWAAITQLCPKRINYWLRASYDMSKNAAAYARGNKHLDAREKVLLSRHYIRRGEEYLLKGLESNPESALLYLELGSRYEDLTNEPQFRKAAEAYSHALERGAPPMYRRWVFYNLCRIRGEESAAWALGRELYREKSQRSPSLLCLLFVLQNKLELPPEERLSPEKLFGSRHAALRQLRLFLRSGLRFPVNGVQNYLDTNSDLP